MVPADIKMEIGGNTEVVNKRKGHNITHNIMHNIASNTIHNTTPPHHHHHPYQTKQSTVDRPSFLRLDHRGDGVLKVEDDLIGVERQDVAPRKRLNLISP